MNTFEEIIQFAIHQEEAEERFYLELANRAENADLRGEMEQQAGEERTHKARLEQILAQHRLPGGTARQPDPDLRIVDYSSTEAIDLHKMGYQDALLLAAKRERVAEQLYRDLARQAVANELRETLLFLADQEARHRQLLERSYDDQFRREH